MAELFVSELSRRSGVPATTLRYYGQVGLLPSRRTKSGYRVYDEHAEERLGFISAAKRLQLPLPAINELLAVWETDPCRSVKGELRPVLDSRIGKTSTGIAELTRLHGELQAARARLNAFPDREGRCEPECAYLIDPTTPEPVDERRPLACSLAAGDYHERIEQWHELLRDCPRVPVDHGVRVTVPRDRAGELAGLVVDEQGCCAFLEFTMTFDRETVALTITAPPGAAYPVEALLPRCPTPVI